MREKCDGGVVMAHGLEGGVERKRPGLVVAMASDDPTAKMYVNCQHPQDV